jgi:predicted transposase YbfD/YdcC
MAAVRQASSGQLVAMDGKTLRGSGDSCAGQGAMQLVSARATANHVVLAQVKVEEGPSEIAAIPQVLEMLELEGCVVTIDAIGCQKGIAAQVVAKEGDYVLHVKANQGQLHEDLQDLFGVAQRLGFRDLPHSYECSVEKVHGRIERRQCRAFGDGKSLACPG